ncbi:phosphatase PAP2 family protein [Nocardioides sp.]|uniref:phosphatase PAP2 family protein n=1 Tax=Nocardioides sp. TaxID=35761 RepID=UPI00260B5766|nr:phosphatase PAP2 family protein [Nocardioides sp.]
MTTRQVGESRSTDASMATASKGRSGAKALPVGALRAHWVVELGVLIALFTAYNLIRAAQGTDISAAFAHSQDILRVEGGIFDHLELPLNTWIGTVPVIAVSACYFYALMHYAMTPMVLLVSRKHGGWHYWRGYWAIVVASGIALVIYAAWPAAPPRLIPGIGIADVMRDFSSYGWWGSAASAPRGIGDATNQFAAMPSLHCGWAFWCSIQMWGFPSKWWRIPAVLYPVLQVIVVMATGNHFLLDILGGAACVAIAYGVMELIRRVSRHRQAARLAAAPEPVALSESE